MEELSPGVRERDRSTHETLDRHPANASSPRESQTRSAAPPWFVRRQSASTRTTGRSAGNGGFCPCDVTGPSAHPWVAKSLFRRECGFVEPTVKDPSVCGFIGPVLSSDAEDTSRLGRGRPTR